MTDTKPPLRKPNWIDRIPWSALLILTLLMGIAPVVPEPHLWEKIKMLFSGTLSRPIDIFDLLMHGAPFVLLVIKGWYHWQSGQQRQGSGEAS